VKNIMTITTEGITSRVSEIDSQIKELTAKINELDKKKMEQVGLLNALIGAKQQCNMFLQEINNEVSDLVSDTGDVD